MNCCTMQSVASSLMTVAVTLYWGGRGRGCTKACLTLNIQPEGDLLRAVVGDTVGSRADIRPFVSGLDGGDHQFMAAALLHLSSPLSPPRNLGRRAAVQSHRSPSQTLNTMHLMYIYTSLFHICEK